MLLAAGQFKHAVDILVLSRPSDVNLVFEHMSWKSKLSTLACATPWLPLALCFVLIDCASQSDHWDYRGTYNPMRWHEISRQTQICRKGHHQSPINIDSKDVLPLKQKLEIFYHKASLKVINNGHTIEFDTLDSHFIRLDGKQYKLLQFHFHAHGEHAVDGRFFPAEMHLVHQSEDGETVVLAVNQQISMKEKNHHVFDAIPKIGEQATVELDLISLLPKMHARYVYDGSLTTPPCTENVTWLIFVDPVQTSMIELDRFLMYYTHNYRPLQPMHLRKVFKVNHN